LIKINDIFFLKYWTLILNIKNIKKTKTIDNLEEHFLTLIGFNERRGFNINHSKLYSIWTFITKWNKMKKKKKR